MISLVVVSYKFRVLSPNLIRFHSEAVIYVYFLENNEIP